MFIFTKASVRNRSRSRPFANRVWARLEELEPRALLAVTALTAAQALPSSPASGRTVATQVTFNAANQTPTGPFTLLSTGNQPGSNNPSAGQPGSAAFVPPNTTPTFPQRTVLSVDLALVALPMDSGALELQTPARSTGEYFLSNQGLLPQTPAALQTVSRLPSLSQGITPRAVGGGETQVIGTGEHYDNTPSLDPFNHNTAPAQERLTPQPEPRSRLPVLPRQHAPALPQTDGGAQRQSAVPDKRWAQACADVFAAEVDGETLQGEPTLVRAPDLLQAAAAAAGALGGVMWYREPAGQRRWQERFETGH
jgi:hypothetical protein